MNILWKNNSKLDQGSISMRTKRKNLLIQKVKCKVHLLLLLLAISQSVILKNTCLHQNSNAEPPNHQFQPIFKMILMIVGMRVQGPGPMEQFNLIQDFRWDKYQRDFNSSVQLMKDLKKNKKLADKLLGLDHTVWKKMHSKGKEV